jgi:ribosomal protein L9
VDAGYARNFPMPRRLAVAATDASKKIVKDERLAALRGEAKGSVEAQDLAKLMANAVVTITQPADDGRKSTVQDLTKVDISTKGPITDTPLLPGEEDREWRRKHCNEAARRH